MLIIGAGGLASEIYDLLSIERNSSNYRFYISNKECINNTSYFDKGLILASEEEVKEYFKKYSGNFIIAFGDIKKKKELTEKLISFGGELTNLFSKFSSISTSNFSCGEGNIILRGSIISPHVTIGNCNLIYYNCNITHEVEIGSFNQISPGVTLLGRCTIGNETFIGANTVILPDKQIGDNCLIGAGTVITKNIPNNSVVYGNPGKIIRSND